MSNEILNKLFEICDALTQTALPRFGENHYEFPIKGHGMSYFTYDYGKHVERTLFYHSEILRVNIYKKSNGEFIIKVNEDQKLLNNKKVLDYIKLEIVKTIYLLKLCYKEHVFLDPPEVTVRLLEEFCSQDIKILIHGTDESQIEGILQEGLNVRDLGLSCRTTAMIDHDINKIIRYDYANFKIKPRIVIVGIPNSIFDRIPLVDEDNRRNFSKCQECTVKAMQGFDYWCYFNNYIYDSILELDNNQYRIPTKYIYGVLDYNGNLKLNEKYLKDFDKDVEFNESHKKMALLRKKLGI